MFSQFQNMLKNLPGKMSQSSNEDDSKIPQSYQINNRTINEKILLSEGAFGFIWKAQDFLTKEEFALKRIICMNRQRAQVALLEKQIMSKLPQNPHLVSYHGSQIVKKNHKTTIIILMELCPNGTLFDQLAKKIDKGFTEDQLIIIALSILKGLHAIHGIGYYHRDIKVENVIVGKDGKYKLCDFGSCTNQIIDFATIPKSQYNDYLEDIHSFTTPMYRAPQMVDPYLKYKVSHKADVWMLGCVIYTLCYFVHPFVDSNAVGIAFGSFKIPTQSKYKVSEKMKDLIRLMLTPNPQNRPSISQLSTILAKWDYYKEIPLNAQAQALKKQHQKRDKNFRSYEEKVQEQYDGDIPIEKLMQLQNKLKDKGQGSTKVTSFINDKQTKKISQQQIYNKKGNTNVSNTISNNKESFNYKNNANNKSNPHTIAQNNIDFWGNQKLQKQQKPQQNNKLKDQKLQVQSKVPQNNRFDVFNDLLGPPKNIPVSNTNNNGNNFMQFFQQTPQISVKKQVKKSQNLLDF